MFAFPSLCSFYNYSGSNITLLLNYLKQERVHVIHNCYKTNNKTMDFRELISHSLVTSQQLAILLTATSL